MGFLLQVMEMGTTFRTEDINENITLYNLHLTWSTIPGPVTHSGCLNDNCILH